MGREYGVKTLSLKSSLGTFEDKVKIAACLIAQECSSSQDSM